MINTHTLFDRYQIALGNYTDLRAKDPSRWHRPDVDAFTELYRLMLPHAEAGDMHCQYAIAGMHELGLCCDSEEDRLLAVGRLLRQRGSGPLTTFGPKTSPVTKRNARSALECV